MRRDGLIPIGSPRPAAIVALAVWSLLGACAAPAEARVTRIVVDEKRSPAYDGESFGRAGTYERITGRVFGEFDPRDRRNAVITDLDLAPRNARGMVEYVATFTLWQPTDPAKASGVLIYAVPNRGNRLFFPAFHLGGEPGDGFFFRRGDAILASGWQGDVVAPGAETITVPVAKNRDGSSITGPVLARFVDMPAGTQTLALPSANAPVDLDTGRATLTRRASEDGAVIPIGPGDWAFADCRKAPFPGTPDPTRLLRERRVRPGLPVRAGLHREGPAGARHRAGGDARHGLVLPVRERDDEGTGTPDPGEGVARRRPGHLAGRQLRPHVPPPRIQRGRVRPDRVGRGERPHRRPPAPDQLPVRPARRRRRHVRARQRGRAVVGRLRGQGPRPAGRPACSTAAAPRAPCPKVFETFGSAEFWGLRMSPNLVGTAADRDIPLPPNVRRYYFPGTTHGGGRGGFSIRVRASDRFELADNPNPQSRDDAGLARRPDRLGRERHGPAAEPLPAPGRGPAGPPRSTGRWASPRSPALRSRTTC